ncbi:hypothetical protein AB0M72_10055 [Nocardiopsis dassonvillei]
MWTITRAAVSALLATTAIGCSAPPDSAPLPEVGAQVRELHAPFDAYRYSRLDIHTIEYAQDFLIRECMRDLGMDWAPLLPPPQSHDYDPLHRRRYGLMEMQVAERFGYHPLPLAPEQAAREEVWAVRANLSAPEQQAAYGSGDGGSGCRARAEARLREDAPEVGPDALNAYSGRAFEASFDVPEVVEVFAEWSACMDSAGFDYAEPFDAFDDPAWAASEHPSEREIRAAVADVRCKLETDLIGVWSAAEHDIQNTLIDAHSEEFAGFAAAKEAELDAARQVIASSGGAE